MKQIESKRLWGQLWMILKLIIYLNPHQQEILAKIHHIQLFTNLTDTMTKTNPILHSKTHKSSKIMILESQSIPKINKTLITFLDLEIKIILKVKPNKIKEKIWKNLYLFLKELKNSVNKIPEERSLMMWHLDHK